MICESVGDQGKLWRVVRFVLRNDLSNGRCKLPSELLLDNGDILYELKEIVSEMNRYFSDVQTARSMLV